jgi:hypothetical protein
MRQAKAKLLGSPVSRRGMDYFDDPQCGYPGVLRQWVFIGFQK